MRSFSDNTKEMTVRKVRKKLPLDHLPTPPPPIPSIRLTERLTFIQYISSTIFALE